MHRLPDILYVLTICFEGESFCNRLNYSKSKQVDRYSVDPSGPYRPVQCILSGHGKKEAQVYHALTPTPSRLLSEVCRILRW